MVSKEITNHFPSFYTDFAENPDNYFLILTDDFDSFYACRFLNRKFGLIIKGFYGFGDGLYLVKDINKSMETPVYVDCAVVKDGICAFDNHRTIGKNHMNINPNIITDRFSDNEYHKKYCGSTLMLVTALYDTREELEALSDTEKEMILVLDKFYLGYYRYDGAFRNINIDWLEKLGLKEILLPVLENHSEQYFDNFIERYHLNDRIWIDSDGILQTYANILPQTQFKLEFKTNKQYVNKEDVENIPLKNDDLLIAAETYGGKYVINTIIQD
ncbi:MAG: hypothetical protein LUC88_08895 [Prevotella sp.]|nr:hypothetical protein [Prevotella sp.]